MPDINENNIDDLFRRAAEQYPLRTDSADWNTIARALDEDDDDPAAGYLPDSKHRFRKLWLLLLLIPIAAIGYYVLRPVAGSTAGKNNNTITATTNGGTKNETANATTSEHEKDNAVKNKDENKNGVKNDDSISTTKPDNASNKKNNNTEKINEQLPGTQGTEKTKFHSENNSIKNNNVSFSGRNKTNDNKSALQHKNHRQIVDGNNAITPQLADEAITANEDVALTLQKGTLVRITPNEPV